MGLSLFITIWWKPIAIPKVIMNGLGLLNIDWSLKPTFNPSHPTLNLGGLVFVLFILSSFGAMYLFGYLNKPLMRLVKMTKKRWPNHTCKHVRILMLKHVFWLKSSEDCKHIFSNLTENQTFTARYSTNFMFTVLSFSKITVCFIRSSYKVEFGHLFWVILTILPLIF